MPARVCVCLFRGPRSCRGPRSPVPVPRSRSLLTTIGRWHVLPQEPSHAPFLLVIFPEGTIIRESSREHGKAYAAKNNLPVPQHMLVPRYGLHARRCGQGCVCAKDSS